MSTLIYDRPVFQSQVPLWVPRVRGRPALDFADFANQQYFRQGRELADYAAWKAPDWTFSRTGAGAFTKDDGDLDFAATGVERFTHKAASPHDPLGLLMEGARTNAIRNSEVAGGTPGTPGVAPTNWNVQPAPTGFQREVVGFGTENGIPYMDIRYWGTASSGNVFLSIYGENPGIVSASEGQVWTGAVYLKRIAASGSWSGAVATGSSGGAATTSATNIGTMTTNLTRYALAHTVGAGDTSVYQRYTITVLNGNTVDVTVRIGLPTLEQGAFASSPILSQGSATTRGADVLSRPWAPPSGGFTVLLEGVVPPAGALAVIWHIGETVGDRILLRREAGTNFLVLWAVKGGVNVGVLNAGVVSPGSYIKAAIRLFPDDIAVSLDGALPVTDNDIGGNLPVTTTERLGSNLASGELWFSTISKRTIFDVPASNSDLQALTA